jgi:hypothetical protein
MRSCRNPKKTASASSSGFQKSNPNLNTDPNVDNDSNSSTLNSSSLDTDSVQDHQRLMMLKNAPFSVSHSRNPAPPHIKNSNINTNNPSLYLEDIENVNFEDDDFLNNNNLSQPENTFPPPHSNRSFNFNYPVNATSGDNYHPHSSVYPSISSTHTHHVNLIISSSPSPTKQLDYLSRHAHRMSDSDDEDDGFDSSDDSDKESNHCGHRQQSGWDVSFEVRRNADLIAERDGDLEAQYSQHRLDFEDSITSNDKEIHQRGDDFHIRIQKSPHHNPKPQQSSYYHSSKIRRFYQKLEPLPNEHLRKSGSISSLSKSSSNSSLHFNNSLGDEEAEMMSNQHRDMQQQYHSYGDNHDMASSDSMCIPIPPFSHSPLPPVSNQPPVIPPAYESQTSPPASPSTLDMLSYGLHIAHTGPYGDSKALGLSPGSSPTPPAAPYFVSSEDKISVSTESFNESVRSDVAVEIQPLPQQPSIEELDDAFFEELRKVEDFLSEERDSGSGNRSGRQLSSTSSSSSMSSTSDYSESSAQNHESLSSKPFLPSTQQNNAATSGVKKVAGSSSSSNKHKQKQKQKNHKHHQQQQHQQQQQQEQQYPQTMYKSIFTPSESTRRSGFDRFVPCFTPRFNITGALLDRVIENLDRNANLPPTSEPQENVPASSSASSSAFAPWSHSSADGQYDYENDSFESENFDEDDEQYEIQNGSLDTESSDRRGLKVPFSKDLSESAFASSSSSVLSSSLGSAEASIQETTDRTRELMHHLLKAVGTGSFASDNPKLFEDLTSDEWAKKRAVCSL